MRSFKVVAQTEGTLIPVGLHTAEIIAVVETESRSKTQQIEVKFKTADGAIRNNWYNLQGFVRNATGKPLDKDGKVINIEGLEGEKLEKAYARRVEDEKSTDICYEILGKFFHHAGFPENEEMTSERLPELLKRNVIIGVMDDGISTKICNTFSVDAVEAGERTMTKKLGYACVLDEVEEESVV
jgi:hypothetical protein